MDFRNHAHPSVPVRRHLHRFQATAHRVILRPFEVAPGPRLLRMVRDFLNFDPEQRREEWEDTLARFGNRHRDVQRQFLGNYQRLLSRLQLCKDDTVLEEVAALSDVERQLLGAYASMEYSYAAAAYFNPSMVPHPDQEGVPAGALRFVLSFRAVGEGHISSLVFRSGMVFADGSTQVDPASPFSAPATVMPDAAYHADIFIRKLEELGSTGARQLLAPLGPRFSKRDLQKHLSGVRTELAATVQWLADCNYSIYFPSSSSLDEQIIFPVSELERNGIEDARFVRFTQPDGSVCWYGTYSAYDGKQVLPQLMETSDFRTFHMCSLNGPVVKNKGLALFPRLVGGDYLMLGRQDGETITLMRSRDPHFWYNAKPLLRPRETWELVQLGNCGPPIETEAGWLVLTHGVGSLRRYCIGAALLDLEHPERVIGRLRQPLLAPDEQEREGYVPNVLYSCGGLKHGRNLILPYAMSDAASGLATIDMESLLGHLLAAGA